MGWGRKDIMVTAAHRYCLGRQTYIVSDCVDWLIYNWQSFDKNCRDRVIQETKEAIENGSAGHIIDVVEWRRLLNEVENE